MYIEGHAALKGHCSSGRINTANLRSNPHLPPLLEKLSAGRIAMWDDEDNNPYASFQRRDSETSEIASPTDRTKIRCCWKEAAC